jgi:hypothetical protein
MKARDSGYPPLTEVFKPEIRIRFFVLGRMPTGFFQKQKNGY